MKARLLRAIAAILGRAASEGDKLVGLLHVVSNEATKAAQAQGNSECPYCQEIIRTVEDHVMWCDLPASLEPALRDEATIWPTTRYGFQISKEWALALTKAGEKK